MTQPEDTPGAPPETTAASELPRSRPGERLAKAIARAGLGSRREAETWIEQGRVAVNGETASTAAVNVTGSDRIEVDGRPLPARERTRLWLYHKPRGYVTTTHDPEGRETVFSILPAELPRVMSIGRLDINTEGLLLLTNDGGLARVLELPETGWLRRYRVRAFGRPDQAALEALKDGVTIDGFAYGAIDAEVERQKNDNVWLKFGLREGKNREVKRVAEHLGLSVNRLIRISFGPFQLGNLEEGGVEEVRTRTLVEQLGRRLIEEAGCDFETPEAAPRADAPRKTGGRGAGRAHGFVAPAPVRAERSRAADPSQRIGRRAPISRPRDVAAPVAPAPGEAEGKPTRTKRAEPIADRRGRSVKVARVARTALEAEAAPKRFRKRDEGAAERFGAAGRPPRPPRADKGAGPRGAGLKGEGPRRPARPTPETEALLSWDARPERAGPRGPRSRDASSADRPVRKPYGDKPRGARPFGDRPAGDRAFRDRPAGDRLNRPRSDRPDAARAERPQGAGPRVSAPRWRDAPAEVGGQDRPTRAGGRPPGAGPRPNGPRGPRPQGERPPRGDRPVDDRPERRSPAGRPGPGRTEGAVPRDRPHRPESGRPPRRDGPGGDRPGGGRPDDRLREGARPSGGARPFGAKPGGGPGGKPRAGGRPGSGAGGFKPRGPGGGKSGGGGGKGRPGGADRRR